MPINFTATVDQPYRMEMRIEGMVRFTSTSHVIKQAARNGQRREAHSK